MAILAQFGFHNLSSLNDNNNGNEILYAISLFSRWKKRPNGYNKLYYEQNQ
jgi:hypothetical protein